jgi:class 3 adenylate cyclase
MCGYRGIVRTKEGILESFRRYVNLLQPGKSSRGSSFVQDPSLLTDHMTEEVLGYMDRTGLNPLKTARRRVTIVFFDIRGSTTIAERLEPEAFASILNDIFTDIMDLVYGHKGSVNKLIGDGMMATFGCPLASGDDAINAVEAAIGIQEYLSTFNDVRPPGIGKDIRAGIGIATGEVFAGLIGSVRRQEYTVLGDAVNVASRLESLTKSLATPILMDEATYLAVRHRLACVQVACGRLRGKADQVRVYALR